MTCWLKFLSSRVVFSALGCLLTVPLMAAENPYPGRIKPLLRERCYACHGALKQEAGLRVDTVAGLIAGGDNGPAVIANQPGQSLLVQRIAAAHESERMPPEGAPLTPAEVALIGDWIAQGAAAPSNETPESDPREHWAFRPIRRPEIPAQASATDPARGGRSPIDAFLDQQLRARGLRPQPPASRATWLRRVTIDLTGLPPSRADLAAFLQDESPDAERTVVDRLLASPQYGERWGRHFMDLWRYSDWWGLGPEVRNSQKHLWHWRDWIVESLNDDLGYDEMLRQMLAADELYPGDLQKLRAGGYLARNYFRFNRTSWLDELLEHTSKGMMGLTLNCAKCHDHKYDPFSSVDYYQFRAIFEPYQVRQMAVPGVIDAEVDGIPHAFDCNLDVPTYRHIRGDDRRPDTSRPLSPAVPACLTSTPLHIEPITLPALVVQPGLRPDVVEAYRKQAATRLVAAEAAVKAAEQQLREATDQAHAAEAAAATDKPSSGLPKLLVDEPFDAQFTARWDIRDGQWAHQDGHVVQQRSGGTRSALRLRTPPPANFEARLRFVTRGGETWKSVGIAFDVGGDGQESLAYVSSYADGPKAQIAYRQGGDYRYPPEAAKARQIPLNVPHDITVRVFGTLVNFLVDGELAVAYRLGGGRHPGAMDVITYDAVAELHQFQLRELLTLEGLVEANGQPAQQVMSLDGPRLKLELAKANLAEAEMHCRGIDARAAADRAQLDQPGTSIATELMAAAARIELEVRHAQAVVRQTQAELDLVTAPADKRMELEQKLTMARQATEAAKAASMATDPAAASPSYTPLSGAWKTPESNLETEESRRKPFPTTSTGRRAAFARWLTNRQHPLTARVAANHVWARHFGRPLVPTVFDFGRKGTPPTHPELLDWLASELMDSNWSLKSLHRQIVLSAAYRRSSSSAGADESTRQQDPENKSYWRMNPQRMESQVVRDSLLFLTGELDLTMGGPSIPTNDEATRRRSLYYFHSNVDKQRFLSMFDEASVLDCYRRTESIVPQQALALENSALANQAAEKIAKRLTDEYPASAASDAAFLSAAFQTILGAAPTAEELHAATEALDEFAAAATTAKRGQPGFVARVAVVQALLNHNDFVTIR